MVNFYDAMMFTIPLIAISIVYFIFFNKKEDKPKTTVKEPVRTILPIVTITANNILLDDNMKIIDGIKDAFDILAKRASIYIFVVVKDMDEAKDLREKIVEEFNGILSGNHILFCQTPIGRASMARQLEAVAFFDYDPEGVHQASIFMPTVLIAPESTESQFAKFRHSSFVDFMTNGQTDFFNILAK